MILEAQRDKKIDCKKSRRRRTRTPQSTERLMHPETTVQVPALSKNYHHKVPAEWNATTRDYPADRSLHEFIEDQVARTPDAPAVVYGTQRLSYGQLNARANRL